MKRFAFRLEAYLTQCRRQEEAEYLRLATLRKEGRRLEEARSELMRRIGEQQEALAHAPSLAAYEANWYVHHIRGLQLELEGLERRLESCRKDIERQRKALMEVRRRLRPVEKLRERRWSAWRQELDKHEQREAEDLHLIRMAQESGRP